jgi:hypothetical protein
MNPFETETMAELCLRQGHRDEALAIYARLAARAGDAAARARLERRIVAIETSPAEQKDAGSSPDPAVFTRPLAAPGIRTVVTDDVATIEWSLPSGTAIPALQLLLVSRTPAGVTTEARSVPVDKEAGRLVVSVPGLHSVRAAAGFLNGSRFVPLARS